MSVRVSLILFFATGVKGVLFNGSCPDVQGTHHSLLMSISSKDLQVAFQVVPFSVEKKSYLFGKQSIGLKGGPRVNFKKDIQGGYQVKLQKRNSGVFVKGNAKLEVQGETLTFTSGIYKNASNNSKKEILVECHQELEEEVRVWIDDDFMFIWSCQDLRNGSFDEAVIIIGKEYLHLNVQKTRSILNTTARKYLGDHMLAKINWPGFGFISTKDDYPCPDVKPIPAMLIICIGFVLILLINVGVIVWFYVSASCVSGRVTYLNQ